MAARRIAVVLFNLGGPDGPAAVEPFLFNLFNDAAIIRVPQPLRWLIAKIVSRRRAPIASHIYEQIGGGSPILPLTQDQARALEAALAENADSESEARVFITMRYWKPFASETARAVKRWAPHEIVLLPLYPQYSTTTTASSRKDWDAAAKAAGLAMRMRTVCCYPVEKGFIAAHVELLRKAIGEFQTRDEFRILFSAHGLPKRVIEAGDPYRSQVEATCAAVMAALGGGPFDWATCFQSRVGPLEWIGPATDKEIERAGAEDKSLIVVPIAFVSEHSETLVELDIEYAKLASDSGVPRYLRVPALGTQEKFIKGLAGLVGEALAGNGLYCPEEDAGRPCGEENRG
ncbi:MAG: ferrochelatase [Parvibaculum sp.]|uniref:ferrochelatase n=1 Tax=Parvibaculum sp. TaxID=2024848 RepID=UPI00284818A8|nr:ferrochelatase [Parvibaculum sp.]MDR3500643.1 ferrochelatase [Parvibaculum sp.]